MKALIITSTVHEKSGWGRYSLATIVGLQKQGIEVEVFSDASHLSLVSFLRNCIRVRKIAKGMQVVHALDAWPFGVYGYAAVIGTAKKFFINGVGTYSVAPLYSLFRGFLLKAAYARAQKVFCISNYTKEQIRAGGVSAEKLITVHLGKNELPAVSPDKEKELRLRFGISEDAFPILLTVGAIKDRKGQLDTLKAATLLKQKYPHILYLIAGSGAQLSYVREIERYSEENGMKENILILKEVEDSTLAFLYSACSIFALNSTTDKRSHHFEGFGMVVVEAYQFSKPAVGSAGSGIEDAIEDGKTGFLTKQNDPNDVAAKIEQILANYDMYAANAKIMGAGFSWNDTTKAYADFYRS